MCYNNTARKYGKKRRRGDMAQLVERRVRNAKVRGSNPLISTKRYHTTCMISFFDIGDSHDFIVALPCNKNPCGLTLRFVNKFTHYAITEASWSLPTFPLISTKKITHRQNCVLFFWFDGDSNGRNSAQSDELCTRLGVLAQTRKGCMDRYLCLCCARL